MLDGARVISERRVGPSASYLDPFFLDRVEVVRGPGSRRLWLRRLRRRHPRPGPGGRTRNLPLEPDSWEAWAPECPSGSAGLELSRSPGVGFRLLLGSLRNYGDYRSSGVTVDNSAARNRSILAGARLQVAGGELSLGWQTDRGHDLGRPTLRSPHMRTFYPEEISDRMNVAFESNPMGGFEQICVEGSTGRYALTTDQERFPSPNQGRRLQRSRVAARHFDFRMQAAAPLDRTRLELGFDVNGRFGLHSENTTLSFIPGIVPPAPRRPHPSKTPAASTWLRSLPPR